MKPNVTHAAEDDNILSPNLSNFWKLDEDPFMLGLGRVIPKSTRISLACCNKPYVCAITICGQPA